MITTKTKITAKISIFILFFLIIGVLPKTTYATDPPSDSVSLWKFDETSGTTASDSTGSHPGTLTNGPTWVTGHLGNAVQLDGTNDYVNIGNISTYDFPNTSFTVTGWFKTSAAQQGNIIAKRKGSSFDGGWMIRINADGTITVRLIGNGATTRDKQTTAAYNNGSWHSFEVVFTTNTSSQAGNNITIYIDGQAAAITDNGGSVAYMAPTSNSLVIGATPDLTGFWNGQIDAVRIYSRALSSSEITQIHNEVVSGGGGGSCSISSFTADNTSPSYNTSTTLRFTLNGSYPWSMSVLAGSPVYLPVSDMTIIPQNQMSIFSVTTDSAEAHNLLDGDQNTKWGTYPDTFPQEIIINLGGSRSVAGLSYYESWTNIDHYQIYVSTNTTDWGAPVATGSFAANTNVTFAPKTGSYLKLKALDSTTGITYAYASELNVYTYPQSSGPSCSMTADSGIRNCTNYVEQSPVSKPDAQTCLDYCVANSANACEWNSGDNSCYVEFGNSCTVQGGFPGWYASVLSNACFPPWPPTTGTGSSGSVVTGVISDSHTYRLSCGSSVADISVVPAYPGPTPTPVPAIMIPNSLGDTTKEVPANNNTSFTVQGAINDAGFADNVVIDQKQYQTWALPNYPFSLEVTNLGSEDYSYYSGYYTDIFGYYPNGNLSNFVPLFKTQNGIADYPGTPVLAKGDKITVSIPALNSITFGLYNPDTVNGNLVGKNSTENSKNISGADLSLAYDAYTGLPNPADLKGYFKFDDGSGNSTSDSSGNGNTGSLNGPTWTAGQISGALDFNGVNSIVNAGSGSSLDNLGPLSISVWIDPRTLGEISHGRIVAKVSSDSSPGWILNLDHGLGGHGDTAHNTIRFNAHFSGGTLDKISDINTVSFNQWQHFVVTWDGSSNASGVHIYKNGVELSYEVSQSTTGSKLDDASNDLIIGNSGYTDGYGSRAFDGKIDDLRMYNRVLTPEEVQALYAYTGGPEGGAGQSDDYILAFEDNANGDGAFDNMTVRLHALPPISINSSLVVCNSETDLPNWGFLSDSAPDITSTTATNYVASHPNCHLEPNWYFQYLLDTETGKTLPLDSDGDPQEPANGDYIGEIPAPPAGTGAWTTFGPTNGSGVAVGQIGAMNGADTIWIREVLKPSYIPFAYPPNNVDVSAEIYCNNDVFIYDNFEFIVPVQGQTYYCVGFNALSVPLPPVTTNVTITKNYGGNVKSVDNLINCGGTCSAAYSQGTIVTLQPIPSSYFKFNGWSGGTCSGIGPCIFTVGTSSINVNASFVARFFNYIEF